MEDDIDIEEHDVLDNPRIRNIFPDIAQIKSEIPDEDYHDHNHGEYQPYSEGETPNHADDSEYKRHGSKIILGSKPTRAVKVREDVQNGESVLVFGRQHVQVKQEIEETEETNYGEEYNQTSTVMILGSKPSKSGYIAPLNVNNVAINNDNAILKSLLTADRPPITNSNYTVSANETSLSEEIDDHNVCVKESRDPAAAVVLLKDWGPILEKNSCYCKECEILFPTSNTLLAHNNIAHSFLVAVEKNKAVKSTSKNTKTENGKFCNHCNKMFPDSDSLINHLYMKLTFDKNNAFKPQPKKVVANPFSKQVNANIVKIQKQNQPKTLGSNKESIGNLFQCELCCRYLKRFKALQKHMRLDHSKNILSAKSVTFDSYCRFCKADYKNIRQYNKHTYYRHNTPHKHKQLEPPLKNNSNITLPNTNATPKKASNIKLPNTNSPPKKGYLIPVFNKIKPIAAQGQNAHWNRFQCTICNKILLNYATARKHKKKMHESMKSLTIFKKIGPNKTVGQNQKPRDAKEAPLKRPENYQSSSNILPGTSESTNTTQYIKKPENQIVIPQSVLFKCDKCEMHFTSVTATVLHSKCCEKQKENWKCNICERTFQSFDKTVHKGQHRITDKFTVVVYHNNIYGRVVNQCPNCRLFFHEKEFYLHDQKSVCITSHEFCEKCILPIHISSVETHNKWHERINTNRNNMIIVKFTNVSVDNSHLSPAKRALDFGGDDSPAKKPKLSDTRKSKKKLVRYCKVCGVFLFDIKNSVQHISGKCKHTRHMQRFCHICGLTFFSDSHMRYHKTHPQDTILDMTFVDLKERKAMVPPIPDFLRCLKCKVHFCKKVTVLRHNCKDSYKICKHCNKKFSDLAYKLHMKFHEYHLRFDASENIPSSSKSIPTNSKVVSTKNSDDPLPELLKKYEMLTNIWQNLFTCTTCDIVCDNYDKVVEHCQKHFNNMESYDMMIEYCDICNLKFDGSCYEKHKDLHAQNKSLTKKSFTLLQYNYRHLLRPYWLDQFKSLPKTQLDQILSRSIYRYGRSVKLRVVQEGPPENTIYRCGQCKNFVSCRRFTGHYRDPACDSKAKKHFCRYCKIPLSSLKVRLAHEKIHQTAKSFNIVYFNEPGDEDFNKTLQKNDHLRDFYALGYTLGKGENKTYNYYKCKNCKCCFCTKSGLYKHRCYQAKSLRRCKLCHSLLFAPLMKRHMLLHELNPRFVKKNIKYTIFENKGSEGVVFENEQENTTATIKLFKCPCGLHFTSTKSVDKHLLQCGTDKTVAKEKCSKCKRLFDTTQLVTHLCKHHSNDKNTKFTVINVSSTVKTPTLQKLKREKSETTDDNRNHLYKCQKCNIHFLTMRSLECHFFNDHYVHKIRSCDYCKLKFTPNSLQKHMQLHHETNTCDYNIHVGRLVKGKMRINKCYNYNTADIPQCKIQETENNSTKADIPQDEIQANEDNSTKADIIPQDKIRANAINSTKADIPQDKVLESKNSSTNVTENLNREFYRKNNIHFLYKCDQCHSHFLHYESLKTHKTRYLNVCSEKCKFQMEDCPDCGLTFLEKSLSRHRYVHHTQKKFKREDFIIEEGCNKKIETTDATNHSSDVDTEEKNEVNIEEEDTSEIEIEKYKEFGINNILTKCTSCNIIFMRNGLDSHMRRHPEKDQFPFKERYRKCCGLRFSIKAYKEHTLIHKKNVNFSRADLYVIPIVLLDDISGSNHLYRCDTCVVHFLSMYKMRLHLDSMGHNYRKEAQECPECDFMISTWDIDKHVKLHHYSMKLRREDFVIMQFTGKNTVQIVNTEPNSDPTADLQSLDIDLKKEIFEKSIVSEQNDELSNKEIKPIHLVAKDNFNDKTLDSVSLFKCNGCGKHFLHSDTLRFHLIRKSPGPNAICTYCGLDFTEKSLNTHVNKHHKTLQFSRSDFTIIDQTEAGYGNYKCALAKKAVNDITADIDCKDHTSDSECNTTDINNKVYRCGKCRCCFLTHNDVRNHSNMCENLSTLMLKNEKCHQCQLVFHKSLSRHIKMHHATPNFKLDDLEIINYSPPEQEELTTVEMFNASEKLSTLDKNLYTNKLFKCQTCALHFLIEESLNIHTHNPKFNIPKTTCTFCGLAFSVNVLAIHVYIHHANMKLNREDFIATCSDEVMEDSEQESSNVHSKPPKNSTDVVEILSTNEISDVNESNNSDNKHFDLVAKNLNTDYDFEATVAIADSLNVDLSCETRPNDNIKNDALQISSQIDVAKAENTGKIKLYKCAACNVCYTTQLACYKHTTKHVPFDTKDYIECKLCGYQFLILNNSLHKHMTKHHQSPFKPEDVLIEEYHPDILCHGTPKIEIYFGSDKLQSKLISTTSDANVSSELSEKTENDNDVTTFRTSETSITGLDLEDNNTANGADCDTLDKISAMDIDLDKNVDIVAITNTSPLDLENIAILPPVYSSESDVNKTSDEMTTQNPHENVETNESMKMELDFDIN